MNLQEMQYQNKRSEAGKTNLAYFYLHNIRVRLLLQTLHAFLKSFHASQISSKESMPSENSEKPNGRFFFLLMYSCSLIPAMIPSFTASFSPGVATSLVSTSWNSCINKLQDFPNAINLPCSIVNISFLLI